jgi:hypothetical protein
MRRFLHDLTLLATVTAVGGYALGRVSGSQAQRSRLALGPAPYEHTRRPPVRARGATHDQPSTLSTPGGPVLQEPDPGGDDGGMHRQHDDHRRDRR